MRARASTYGSVGTVLLIGGLALILGSGGSALLVALGALVAVAGVAGFATGVVLHVRASRTIRRV